MKLNYDCLRDVLLVLEENLQLNENLSFKHMSIESLYSNTKLNSENYSREDIFYSTYNLMEIGFIKANVQYGSGAPQIFLISNITYDGHEFIQSIKGNNVWKNIKQQLAPYGGLTIPIIQKLASDFILDALHFG